MLSSAPICFVAAVALVMVGKLRRNVASRQDVQAQCADSATVPANLWVACTRPGDIRDVVLDRKGDDWTALRLRYAGNSRWYCVAQGETDIRVALRSLGETGTILPYRLEKLVVGAPDTVLTSA